jgi:predicted nucleic acid-binding protein
VLGSSQIRISGEYNAAIPLPKETVPDMDDLPFVEVAVTGQAEALVTGNTKIFSAVEKQLVKVLSPSQVIDQVA